MDTPDSFEPMTGAQERVPLMNEPIVKMTNLCNIRGRKKISDSKWSNCQEHKHEFFSVDLIHHMLLKITVTNN